MSTQCGTDGVLSDMDRVALRSIVLLLAACVEGSNDLGPSRRPDAAEDAGIISDAEPPRDLEADGGRDGRADSSLDAGPDTGSDAGADAGASPCFSSLDPLEVGPVPLRVGIEAAIDVYVDGELHRPPRLEGRIEGRHREAGWRRSVPRMLGAIARTLRC